MQINKNTTTIYVSQHERDGSMISQRIGREIIQTLEPIGQIQMSKGKTHKAVNYPFCLFVPIINFYKKLVEEVISLGWERYGGQNLNCEDHPFQKNIFWLIGQIRAQKFIPHPLFTHVFHFSSPTLHSRCALSRSWSFLCFSPSHVQLFSSFSIHKKSIFVLMREWPAQIHDFGVYSNRFFSCNTQNRC